MSPNSNSICVVSGLGNASGTAATARLFAVTLGYRVALVSRPRKDVEDLKKEIIASGGVAEIFSSNIPFMEIKESDIKLSVQLNMAGEEVGGTLIMTGATSAWRGQHSFGAFAAGKHGLRAISQSIAREYGPQGVHVAFVVIDGTILTKRTAIMFGARKEEGWLQDPRRALTGDMIAKTYQFLHEQPPGAWTLEMDLRPSQEKF
ncbi:hypothetical protein RQP46_000471 [Phenoliferia psychrophenolica]